MTTAICSVEPDSKKATFQWYKIRYSNAWKACGSSSLIRVPYTSTIYQALGVRFGTDFTYKGTHYAKDGTIYKAPTVTVPDAPDIQPSANSVTALFAGAAGTVAQDTTSEAAPTDENSRNKIILAIVAIPIIIMVILSILTGKK
ncbi:MAG: hypothetical protein KAJ03_10835 [Gammaproteobacteria bacterium]|nr:hypothetical protein [Gammaproteobacteria bacterium]